MVENVRSYTATPHMPSWRDVDLLFFMQVRKYRGRQRAVKLQKRNKFTLLAS
jgi:hypothetical protein